MLIELRVRLEIVKDGSPSQSWDNPLDSDDGRERQLPCTLRENIIPNLTLPNAPPLYPLETTSPCCWNA